ncbi:proline-rich receptor-like protein kinase PERK3 [Heracleum sosnowskyi]|uniref:Proline-rich receptor-like protein kinase PERK3 n=1 Tax=Heracleum sosnowskyi TaxID=360622 RepID=A0AAD8IEZ3_9APIA|nr:proline-rich receptor-like protein kinase PERK3 [Heracleum sosnowskyi]
MDEDYLDIYGWYGILHQILVVSIFVLIGSVECAKSDGSACVLDHGYGASSSLLNLSKVEGDWGGFLNKNSCAGPFEEYLYALAWHTSQTGDIFLNSDEQSDCLTTINGPGTDDVGCGIEKLTKGGGGCSDFSVKDVNNRLGDDFRSMKEKCELEDQGKNQDQSCGSCLRSWEGIKGTYFGNDEPTESESYMCKFAVLVSLISTKIDDEIWIHKTFGCLMDQNQTPMKEVSPDSGAPVPKEKRKISKRTRIIFGIALGILMVVIIPIYLFSRGCCKPNTRKKDDALRFALPKDSGHLKFSIKEVYSATNNLHTTNFIGEGIAGKVYKGILRNNQHVAIKQITDEGYTETFFRELKSLSKVRHPNLVALLGYCRHKDECFLLYELCPNGNLSEWIFGKDKRLSWVHRLKIAINCARGLCFLHNYPKGCIVHRDIKPTNILLGANFEAKLSDFGLSKVIDIGESYKSSEVRGTFGYVDPEYQNTRRVDPSGDVYSFGVVLLQIISGRKVINMNMNTPMPLHKMAKSLTRNDSIRGFADPALEGDYSEQAFSLTFKLALSCTTRKKERPSMDKVTIKLEEALDISITASSSTPLTTPDSYSSPT